MVILRVTITLSKLLKELLLVLDPLLDLKLEFLSAKVYLKLIKNEQRIYRYSLILLLI